MHEMDNTKKIITIIGLVFEFLSVGGILLGIWVLKNFENLPGADFQNSEMSAADLETMKELFAVFVNVLYILLAIVGIVFIINLFLFTKLIRGQYTEEQAKKVYLYQAIWGAINLISNQIVGILYLISGVGGYNDHKEEKDIRHGI